MKTIFFDGIEYEIVSGNCKNCPFIKGKDDCKMAVDIIQKYCLNGYTFKRIMTKKDIRPGMVVELRNGSRYFAIKVELGCNDQETIIFIGPTGYMGIDDYDENLLVKPYPYQKEGEPNSWDIVKVYNTNQNYGLGTQGLLSDNGLIHFNLLWTRKETVEISLKDISQKFNVPISQIRIKE